MGILLAVTGLILWCTGAGTTHAVTSAHAAEGPWTPGVRSRQTSQLRLAASVGGATGSIAGTVGITNVSPSACVLNGYAAIRLVDGRGHLVPTVSIHGPKDKTRPRGAVSADQRHGILRPRHGASFYFLWTQWCGGKLRRPLYLSVRLPATSKGVRTRIEDFLGRRRWATPPRCDSPGQTGRSTLDVGPIEVA